jgi:hypothetical protein
MAKLAGRRLGQPWRPSRLLPKGTKSKIERSKSYKKRIE